MDISSVSPNVLYAGYVVLIVAAGVAEKFGLVPAGTLSVLVGTALGSGVAHASYAIGNNAAVKLANAESAKQTGGTNVTPPTS